ncbi:MAG TPA: Xaa-Pro peptidase family protein [Candidatus Limnocylindria bacterium]|nr:Xaa-Pro peptidase family protein [Candidatus Limnocylindria bacterium]
MEAGSRLERARAILRDQGLDALLVSRSAAKRWLSGFTLGPGEEATSGWSGTLLLTGDAQLVLADARYTEQAERECPGWEVRRTRGEIHTGLPPVAAELGVTRLGAEARVLSHAAWSGLTAAGLLLQTVDDELERLRVRKDLDEVAAIERACALTDRCLGHLLGIVRPGTAESEVAWEIADWFRQNGAEALAFEPLVLAGPRAAMPHGRPSGASLTVGQALLIDFGCQVDGYRSDMTRTVYFGRPDAEARRRYQAVREAQERAFEAVAVGVAGTDVDAVARDSLARAGLGEAFTHGLGHGIGLETHEEPRLLTWDRPLEEGMVFTLEPGVYFPGEMGIRIEDDVVLEASGPRRLTHSPRELLVL